MKPRVPTCLLSATAARSTELLKATRAQVYFQLNIYFLDLVGFSTLIVAFIGFYTVGLPCDGNVTGASVSSALYLR